MKNIQYYLKKNVLLFLLIPILLLSIGCLNWEEEITIDKVGNAVIKVKFEGSTRNPEMLVALPSSSEWTITENSKHKKDNGEYKIKYKAEKNIKYGTKLPESFAGKSDKFGNQMQFPTNFKVWKEGKRTYYEFERTYKGRSHREFNFLADTGIDRELENRIIENGIFNVSEADRQKYLNQLKEAYQYSNYKMFFNVLGEITLNDKISFAQRKEILQIGIKNLENLITDERLIALLNKEDATLEIEYNKLKDEILKSLSKAFVEIVGDNNKLGQLYKQMFDEVYNNIQITDELNPHEFLLVVNFPGEVIISNGLIDIEEPNTVGWMFKGNELHDCDMSFYALSVVEE